MLRSFVLGLAVLTATLGLFGSAAATVWRVPGDGNEIANVVEALAAPGDTVQVFGNGGATFFTRFVIDKDLTLQGGWRADFQVRDPSIYVTVLRDIEDSFLNERPIIRVEGSPRVVIEGLTIIGGRFGIRADEGATLIVRDCVIRNQLNLNIPSEGFRLSGGGLRLVGGALWMENTRIRNVSSAIHGAGIALIDVNGANIYNTTIRNCLAIRASGLEEANGAALYAVDCGLLNLFDCRFESNTTINRGGHVFVRNTPLSVSGTLFERGAGGEQGGALYCESTSALSVDDCVFQNCVSPFGAGIRAISVGDVSVSNTTFTLNLSTREGSGLNLEQSPFTISDCAFESNNQVPPLPIIAAQRGGAVRSVGSSGMITNTTFDREFSTGRGGAWSQTGGDLVFRQCRFEGNESSLVGGAVHIDLAGVCRLEQSLVLRSRSKFGGALAGSFAARIETDHVTIAEGGASLAGAALYLETAAHAELANSVFCCALEGDLVSCSASSFSMSHCDIWNDDVVNPQTEFGTGCSNPLGANGNISADPVFCDPAGGEFGLQTGSPCAGAGVGGSDIGWAAVGCPRHIPLSVVPDSWGRIKARYRMGRDVSDGVD